MIWSWVGHRLSKRVRGVGVGEIAPNTVLVKDAEYHPPEWYLDPKNASAQPSKPSAQEQPYRAERPAGPWIPPPTQENDPSLFDRISALMTEDDAPQAASKVPRSPRIVPVEDPAPATPERAAAPTASPAPQARTERPRAPWIPPATPEEPSFLDRLKAFFA